MGVEFPDVADEAVACGSNKLWCLWGVDDEEVELEDDAPTDPPKVVAKIGAAEDEDFCFELVLLVSSEFDEVEFEVAALLVVDEFRVAEEGVEEFAGVDEELLWADLGDSSLMRFEVEVVEFEEDSLSALLLLLSPILSLFVLLFEVASDEDGKLLLLELMALAAVLLIVSLQSVASLSEIDSSPFSDEIVFDAGLKDISGS